VTVVRTSIHICFEVFQFFIVRVYLLQFTWPAHY